MSKAKELAPETLRETICRRAKELELGPYDLAGMVGGVVSKDQIWRYLTDRSDLTSARVDALMRALGLRIAAT